MGWGVHLIGHPYDLADWAAALKPSFDPWVDRQGDNFFLRGSGFDVLTDATEVRDYAVSIVEQLNAAMEITVGARRVRFEGIVEFRPDGTKHTTMFVATGAVEARGRAAAMAVVIGPDGNIRAPDPPKQSQVQQWALLSEQHELLGDALVYFSRAEWFDVYKAIECLEDWVGGENALFDRNWIEAKTLKRLKRTANSFRHREGGQHTPPTNPFSLMEARETLAVLMRGAFDAAKNGRT